jgi:predicted O-methyltransferase YrrM
MNRYENTFLQLDELGAWPPPEYRPTFDFPEEFIDADHRYYAECPTENELIQVLCDGLAIKGWQLRQDALKLYELAYFCSGDILEIGIANGLSTSVLSKANHNSGLKKTIYSVDVFQGNVDKTFETIRKQCLEGNVQIICDDAVSAAKRFVAGGKRFEFVFIDHDHAYQPTHEICLQLKQLLISGGFCLFHDFNHAGNADPNNADYGVYRAVMDTLSEVDFEFYGVFGATALFRAV